MSVDLPWWLLLAARECGDETSRLGEVIRTETLNWPTLEGAGGNQQTQETRQCNDAPSSDAQQPSQQSEPHGSSHPSSPPST